ncbi:hypothetical protein HPP92_008242 [Vanilla planifolia]|uniref:Uncharacterized protein n=1 Tax=Vanilla planifolia TaxID=51239 RepID=A0A835RHN2_VANPL|nr:hypothetical protein HPP92_008242 [Vanilla planifolia]
MVILCHSIFFSINVSLIFSSADPSTVTPYRLVLSQNPRFNCSRHLFTVRVTETSHPFFTAVLAQQPPYSLEGILPACTLPRRSGLQNTGTDSSVTFSSLYLTGKVASFPCGAHTSKSIELTLIGHCPMTVVALCLCNICILPFFVALIDRHPTSTTFDLECYSG